MEKRSYKSTDLEEGLFFIAIIPPEPVYTEALNWKHFFAEHYQSKAALNSPPHITLHMPFKWKLKKEDKLLNSINAFVQQQKTFEVALKNYGAFPPRVIYMDVMKSEPLTLLQKELFKYLKENLQLFNANYKDKPFHPHLTLAFRDLKKKYFEQAWADVKDKTYEAMFTVKDITLLKHNGKHWEVFKNFDFLS
jgi:2'-5' RNA ligase